MHQFVLLLVGCMLATGIQSRNVADELPVDCGKSPIGREFPWLARVIYAQANGTRTFGCMGFLIAPSHILTTNECIRRQEKFGYIQQVILGDDDLSSENEEHREWFDVSTISKHPTADIAVVRLDGVAKAQPICLNRHSTTDDRFTIAGWGCDGATLKDKKEIFRASMYSCQRAYWPDQVLVSSVQMCAADVGNRYSCIGVPGVPLMHVRDDGKWYAEAMYKMTYIDAPNPSVFTRLPPFRQWIAFVVTDGQKEVIHNELGKYGMSQPRRPFHGTYVNGFQ